MARIFISYSRADVEFIESFVPYLRKSFPHITFWYDADIHGGADWWKMILGEIGKADIFMYLMSNDSLDSDYCRAEMQEALRQKKLFLPVMIRPKTDVTRLPDDLERIVRRTNWIDLAKGTRDSVAAAGLTGSIHILLNNIPAEAPMPDSPDPVAEPSVPTKPAVASSQGRSWGIGAVVTVLVAVVIIAFILQSGVFGKSDEKPTQTPTEVAQNPSDTPTDTPPTDTLTPEISLTPTATDTPTATLELLTQIAQEFTQTAEASAAYASATAAQWTYTPSNTPTPTDTLTATPNFTETYEQARADFAASLTATVWTLTPTNTSTPTATLTPTPTPTFTATLTPRQQAEILALEGVTANADWEPYSEIINGVEMVLVPTGCFMMGSEDGAENEKPVHEQCFEEPFWIDKTEVTRAMYADCVADGVCSEPSSNRYSTQDNQPINHVTWYEARDYCQWRDARLPTEREWEYAARGPDSLVYPWGNDFVADNAVYGEKSGNVTAEVGSRPAGMSWVAAQDMSGNVWEWTSSVYRAYPYNVADGQETNDTSETYVLRGNSFGTSYDATISRRGLIPPIQIEFIGYRCARSY